MRAQEQAVSVGQPVLAYQCWIWVAGGGEFHTKRHGSLGRAMGGVLGGREGSFGGEGEMVWIECRIS